MPTLEAVSLNRGWPVQAKANQGATAPSFSTVIKTELSSSMVLPKANKKISVMKKPLLLNRLLSTSCHYRMHT